VLAALSEWAERAGNENTKRIGFIGSYARGDWGVGSDLDIVVVVDKVYEPFENRSRSYDTTDLPVPTDLLVFSEEELRTHPSERLRGEIESTAVWVYQR